MVDLRKKDIAKLSKAGIHRDWIGFWENKLHPEISEISDMTQKDWHNSRMSFLEGFKLGKKVCYIKRK